VSDLAHGPIFPYGPWTWKNITNYQFSGLFSLCLQIGSFALQNQDTNQV
jgi:hypothetical protein